MTTSVGQTPVSPRGGSADALQAAVAAPATRRVALAVKRALDLAGAAASLALLSPVLAVIAIAILATAGRPLLFIQPRVGRHGRPFRMVKFRTMVPDSATRYPNLVPPSEAGGPSPKMAHDPRVTRLGLTLRRHSLDELPQLWNVLIGEMSLVGPRPALPGEMDESEPRQRRRLEVMPGMTGLWQVSARSDLGKRTALDLEYVDRWSLHLDAAILLRTAVAVTIGTGR